nr:hypothetical protein [uncultured Sphaerochaeta sp.]
MNRKYDIASFQDLNGFAPKVLDSRKSGTRTGTGKIDHCKTPLEEKGFSEKAFLPLFGLRIPSHEEGVNGL